MEDEIFNAASVIGSLAFGMSGLLLGVRKELDVMGLFIVAMLTANGGGVVRDVLVGRTPSVLVDITGAALIFFVMVICLVLRVHKFDGLERRLLFVVSDSVGLVAFSITGALVAIDSNLNIFGVVTLAFITATGGGIIRDILVNEVPSVLSSGFYGSVAVIIGFALYIMQQFEAIDRLYIALVFVIALSIRLIAHYYNWHLPRIIKGHPYISEIEK